MSQRLGFYFRGFLDDDSDDEEEVRRQLQHLALQNLFGRQQVLRSGNLVHHTEERGYTSQHQCHEINPRDIVLSEKLGEGSFGVVRRGKWRGKDVAVKMMKVGQTSQDEFVREANIMMSLNHPNVVKLYGVSLKSQPIYIVTEYMKHGSLLSYLRKNERSLEKDTKVLMNMSYQICKGMAYLEQKNFIHRDLAARNCLISDFTAKVADFGLSRYVPDDIYSGHFRTIFAGKWASPEVLRRRQFSSKSDVWSFGILMWEIFTCGEEPYGALNNMEVAEKVLKGYRLEKPRGCRPAIYKIMQICWKTDPDERPSFEDLVNMLDNL